MIFKKKKRKSAFQILPLKNPKPKHPPSYDPIFSCGKEEN